MAVAYSFKDVQATIVGPGGVFNLGDGAGAAEEGISIEMNEDKDGMTVGADGTVMHSLHASNAGKVSVRLLKTSSTNGMLMAMYNFQRLSSATWGQNVLVVRHIANGDTITCQDVAFARAPNLNFAKEGGNNDWVFNAGRVDGILGIS